MSQRNFIVCLVVLLCHHFNPTLAFFGGGSGPETDCAAFAVANGKTASANAGGTAEVTCSQDSFQGQKPQCNWIGVVCIRSYFPPGQSPPRKCGLKYAWSKPGHGLKQWPVDAKVEYTDTAEDLPPKQWEGTQAHTSKAFAMRATKAAGQTFVESAAESNKVGSQQWDYKKQGLPKPVDKSTFGCFTPSQLFAVRRGLDIASPGNAVWVLALVGCCVFVSLALLAAVRVARRQPSPRTAFLEEGVENELE